MKRIGLTGGAGAGKSRVCDILREDYGADVIIADNVSRALMEPGQPGYEAVVRSFGNAYVREDGSLDRPGLAGLIFRDAGARLMMDSLIHPMTWKMIEEKIYASQAELIVVEFAIVGDADSRRFDELWYVYATEEVRRKRLMENRGYTMERVRGMFDSQLTDKEFRGKCDRVIDNNGSVEDVKRQLSAILK